MKLLFSTKFKMKFNRVLTIAFVWGLLGFLDPIFIWCVGQAPYMQLKPSYNFVFDLLFTPVAYFVGGLVAAILLVFVLRGRWRKQKFWVGFLANSLIITAAHFLLSTLAYACIFMFNEDAPFFGVEAWHHAISFLSTPLHLKNSLIIFMIAMGTIMWIRVNDRFGPGNLLASFIGKYHPPKEEERIFMFLDLKSSTTIAEKLGHIRFHQFLDDVFRDVSDPILFSRGEIYQYVGDEVIVSWTLKKGLENANCIFCFFEIVKQLSNLSDFYRKKYDGILPIFKAGLHTGQVTTGEIGEIRRELVHSGDVMNTTARIQAKCNDFNANIIISQTLLDKLKMLPASFDLKRLGKQDLRGKQEQVVLYTFEMR
jgi:adenylate cyclase